MSYDFETVWEMVVEVSAPKGDPQEFEYDPDATSLGNGKFAVTFRVAPGNGRLDGAIAIVEDFYEGCRPVVVKATKLFRVCAEL